MFRYLWVTILVTGKVGLLNPATGEPLTADDLGWDFTTSSFSSGAGWTRVFDGATDTTKLVLLAVKVPAIELSPNCTIRITHYWSEVGTSSKNIVLGHTDTTGGKAFYTASSNSGTAVFQTNEIQFKNSLTYPTAPNQGYGSGGSNNGPVTLSIDGAEGVDILFYTYANANLTNAESITLENVKVEVVK